jgi:hypothetical protein
MTMYLQRASLVGDSNATKDLNQGDVLRRLPVPKPPLARSITTLRGPKVTYPFSADSFGQAVGKEEGVRALRLMLEVELVEYAIVLSNACDNTDGTWQLLVAPISPFEFSPEADSDSKKWRQISVAATGATAPKQFYLPRYRDMPRSKVELARIAGITHEYLARCVLEIGTDRAFGLTDEAQRHLQRTLDLFFARNAREDYDWPSREDLELKKAWLEQELARGGRRQESNKKRLEELVRILGNWEGPEG